MKEPAIDLPDVLERVQHDRELLFELFDIFQDDFILKRKSVESLLTAQRATAIRDLAHSLKGAAGNISAKAIFAICLRMEQNSDQGDLSHIREDLTLLDGEFACFQDFVRELKANPKKYFPNN